MEKFVDLSDWTVIKISGKDLKEYLDGLVPNNLDNLELERSMFLTPKAKILVIFWIEKIDDTVIMYTPPTMRDKLIEMLLKYKLSMDVKLEDITAELPPLYLKSSDKYLEGLGNYVFYHSNEKPDNVISYTTFRENMMKSKETVPEALLNQNPFEVGFGNSIYLPKGCFMGQEPLARMYNIGKPRFFLYSIYGEGLTKGEIEVDGKVVGEILDVDSSTENAVGLVRTSQSVDNLGYKHVERIGSYPEFKRL